jgi:hypothetical protein
MKSASDSKKNFLSCFYNLSSYFDREYFVLGLILNLYLLIQYLSNFSTFRSTSNEDVTMLLPLGLCFILVLS